MSKLAKQIRASRIPYPQKFELEQEICSDLAQSPSHNNALLSVEDLRELEEIHSSKLTRALENAGPGRSFLETVIAYLPLIIVGVTIYKEQTMIEFIREGGAGMYAILFIGLFLMAREIKSVFLLLIARDHRKENLRIDTWSVVTGCSALMLLGVGGSALGVYVSMKASLAAAASLPILLTGLSESLAPLILSALICACVMLAHFATRRVMSFWRAPI